MEDFILGFLFVAGCNVLDRLEPLPEWDRHQAHTIVAVHRFLVACEV